MCGSGGLVNKIPHPIRKASRAFSEGELGGHPYQIHGGSRENMWTSDCTGTWKQKPSGSRPTAGHSSQGRAAAPGPAVLNLGVPREL